MINDVPDGSRDRRIDGAGAIAPLVAALAATLLAAGFAGCGGGGSEGSSSTSASVSTTPSTSPQTTSTSTGVGATTTGGKKDSGSQQQDATPRESVTAVLTRVTPENCTAGIAPRTTNVTEHYVHAAYGDTAGCIRAQQKGALAKSLSSYSEEIKGNMATAEVRPVGGIYDGEKITVSLVQEGGSWKVDGLKSNAPVGP